MNLAIDIGNTRTKVAVFKGNDLLHQAVWGQLTVAALKTLAYNQNIEKVILSSVSEQPGEVLDFLKNSFSFLELTDRA